MKNNTWQVLENAILETLEDRRMMSATPLGTATLDQGVLTVNGDAKQPTNMVLNFTRDGSRIQVRAGQTLKSFQASQVQKLVVNAGSGADYIYIDPRISIPADVHGGDGNDVIKTGAGDDTIDAGAGNDLVHAKRGNNVVYGGAGNDTLLGDLNNDEIHGGAGNDFAVGAAGADSLYGDAGNDSLHGGSGADDIGGGAGADFETGGLGDDLMTGDDGNDVIVGDSGVNQIDGGAGVNSINPVLPGHPNNGSTTDTDSGDDDDSDGGNGGTDTDDGGTDTDTGGGGGPVINPDNTASTPTAVMTLIDGIRQTGLSVSVDALASTLGAGTPLTARYEWNFGDTGTRFNTMVGYNAAHVYDTPGTYSITLKITNEDGGVATVVKQVNIAASTRKQIFVDPASGNDASTGLSQSSAVKTIERAFNLISDNTEILLKAGGRYDVTASLHLDHKNILVGRWGSGFDPVINRIVGGGTSTIRAFTQSDGVTFQNLTFDSPYGVTQNQEAPKNKVSALFLGGKNLTVRNCTFLNVDDAINENQNPTGTLIQDNNAPLDTGIRGYFVWASGRNQVIVGNNVANSTREHVMRMVDIYTTTVSNNTFDNIDRRSNDQYDYSKGGIEVHRGEYVYVSQNTMLGGDIRTGPLGLWGEDASTATDWVVIEDNNLTDTFVYTNSSSHHVMIRNNVVKNDTTSAFNISGPDAQGRISGDITLLNNTAIANGTLGNFVRVGGHVNGIVMKNNVWVAPNVAPGSHSAGAVNVIEGNLSSFTEISGNIWPAANGNAGGVNLLGSQYQTAQTWESYSQVTGDQFENVEFTGDTYQIALGSLTAGADLALAA